MDSDFNPSAAMMAGLSAWKKRGQMELAFSNFNQCLNLPLDDGGSPFEGVQNSFLILYFCEFAQEFEPAKIFLREFVAEHEDSRDEVKVDLARLILREVDRKGWTL